MRHPISCVPDKTATRRELDVLYQITKHASYGPTSHSRAHINAKCRYAAVNHITHAHGSIASDSLTLVVCTTECVTFVYLGFLKGLYVVFECIHLLF